MHDDRLRQAVREVMRDPLLFIQQLDEATRYRLFTSLTWGQLLELIGSMNLNKEQLVQLNGVVGELNSSKWWTIPFMGSQLDLRTATLSQLQQAWGLCQKHEILPPDFKIPKVKHWLVRNRLQVATWQAENRDVSSW